MDSICLPELALYAALIPCYDNGNAVKTVNSHGETGLICRGIKSVMRALERHGSIDMINFRKNYEQYVNKKKLIPIPLSIDTVMVPVRVRKAVGVNDGAFAYINMIYISEISGEKEAVVRLTCGYEIATLETASTVQRRFKMGYIVREKYCADVLNKNSMKDALISINDEYNKPAVKGDIALIIHELVLIRNKIEAQK